MDATHSDAFSFDWSYPAAFVGGLLILASWAGWGQFVRRWLEPKRAMENREWGLAAALGLAMFLVMSGPLLMLSIFSHTFLALFLLTGLVLLAGHFRLTQGKMESWEEPPTKGLKVVFIGLLWFVGLSYAGAVAAHWFNPYDDLAAYFSLTKMLLDTGTLFDPFSFRLLGALGGQTAIDALVVAFLPWKYLHLPDSGIALLIVLGLTQEMVRGGDKRAWTARLLLLALAVTFPAPRINTASMLTGTVLFMALFRSFDLIATHRVVGMKAALLVGGVTAAAATLRAHNIFVIAVLGAGFTAWRFWEERSARREIIRETLLMVVVIIVLLTPWWVVAYRSSGSFLYPMFRGTHRPDFETFTSHLSLPATLRFIGSFLVSYDYLPLFFPLCLLKAGRERRSLLVCGAALFLISLALIAQLTFGLPRDINRYLAPMGLAFGLYTAGVAARQLTAAATGDRPPFDAWRIKLAVMMAVLALLPQGFDFLVRSIINADHIAWAVDARHQFWIQPVGALTTVEAGREYEEAFRQIPPGGRTLIALDYPFLLDYRTHQIFSVDVAGAASPTPGLPYFHGATPVKDYLLAQGIRYIAQVPFDRSELLHSRKTQNLNLAQPIPAYRYYATFEIDFFNNVDELAKTNRILYDAPTIRVIDLQGE